MEILSVPIIADSVPFLTCYEPREGRFPGLHQRVKVYRNLNRPGLFSLMGADGSVRGKVLGYAPSVHLIDVTFVVSQASRLRVLSSGTRNVHAFAVGRLLQTRALWLTPSSKHQVVTYSPFLSGHFFERGHESTPVTQASACWLEGANAYIDKSAQEGF